MLVGKWPMAHGRRSSTGRSLGWKRRIMMPSSCSIWSGNEESNGALYEGVESKMKEIRVRDTWLYWWYSKVRLAMSIWLGHATELNTQKRPAKPRLVGQKKQKEGPAPSTLSPHTMLVLIRSNSVFAGGSCACLSSLGRVHDARSCDKSRKVCEANARAQPVILLPSSIPPSSV